MLIEIIFLQEFSKDLSSNPHRLPAKVILIQRIGFSQKKKNSSWINNLHHLYSIIIFIFFTFFDNEQIFKKKKTKFSKKALGLGALGSYFLGFFQKKKKIKIFSSLKKFKISKFFKKKKSSIKIFNSLKKFKISKIFKNKKKKEKKEEGNFQKRPWD